MRFLSRLWEQLPSSLRAFGLSLCRRPHTRQHELVLNMPSAVPSMGQENNQPIPLALRQLALLSLLCLLSYFSPTPLFSFQLREWPWTSLHKTGQMCVLQPALNLPTHPCSLFALLPSSLTTRILHPGSPSL